MLRDPLIGAVLDGRYRLDAILGRGGFGTVYRGSHLHLGRPVAVKILGSGGDEALHRERFRREALVLDRLRHPSIVRLKDFGEVDGLVYMVQEFVEGVTLADRVRLRGTLTLPESAAVLGDVLDGLHEAHAAGIVHRDVKPANIMLLPGGEGRLLDFGIAILQSETRQTSAGLLLGTPAFMAPEYIKGGLPGPSVDLYAVGGVLYYCLTGQAPFILESDNPLARLLAQIDHPPPRLPPDIDPELQPLIDRALAKEPSDRFVDAAEMAGALRSAAAGTLLRLAPADVEERAPGSEESRERPTRLLPRGLGEPAAVTPAAVIDVAPGPPVLAASIASKKLEPALVGGDMPQQRPSTGSETSTTSSLASTPHTTSLIQVDGRMAGGPRQTAIRRSPSAEDVDRSASSTLRTPRASRLSIRTVALVIAAGVILGVIGHAIWSEPTPEPPPQPPREADSVAIEGRDTHDVDERDSRLDARASIDAASPSVDAGSIPEAGLEAAVADAAGSADSAVESAEPPAPSTKRRRASRGRRRSPPRTTPGPTVVPASKQTAIDGFFDALARRECESAAQKAALALRAEASRLDSMLLRQSFVRSCDASLWTRYVR